MHNQQLKDELKPPHMSIVCFPARLKQPGFSRRRTLRWLFQTIINNESAPSGAAADLLMSGGPVQHFMVQGGNARCHLPRSLLPTAEPPHMRARQQRCCQLSRFGLCCLCRCAACLNQVV